jgi:hypothetical protein
LIESRKPSDRRQDLRQPAEVRAREHPGPIVALPSEIGRVEIEQRRGRVVASDELAIGKVLDDDAGEPLVELDEDGPGIFFGGVSEF